MEGVVRPTAVLVCAVAGVIVASVAAARPSTAEIVYADREGSAGVQPRLKLASARAGTSSVVVSGPTGGLISNPAWSPDGSEIAFAQSGRSSADAGIWLVRRSGGKRRQLTSGDDRGPHWSPDGHRIAFVRTTTSPDGLRTLAYLTGRDGRGLRAVADAEQAMGGGGHGSALAVVGWLAKNVLLLRRDEVLNFNSCSHLAVLRIGSTARRIGPFHRCVAEAAISPRRKRLALRVSRRIAVERADGTQFRWVTSGRYLDSGPVWSANGTALAFSRELRVDGSDPTSAVATIGVNGRSLRLVTGFDRISEPLGWSPAGNLLLFESRDPVEDFGQADLYVSRADGSHRVKIATRAAAGSASWRPR